MFIVTDNTQAKKCLACDRTAQETPLIPLDYQEATLWICPKHMPMLIHNPAQLAGKLPGAENLEAGGPPK